VLLIRPVSRFIGELFAAKFSGVGGGDEKDLAAESKKEQVGLTTCRGLLRKPA
jgi:hypothetical protein